MGKDDASPVAVPEPSEKAMRYYRSGNVLWFVNLFWGLLIPALFLFTGFSARISVSKMLDSGWGYSRARTSKTAPAPAGR